MSTVGPSRCRHEHLALEEVFWLGNKACSGGGEPAESNTIPIAKGLSRREIGRSRKIAVLKPLHSDVQIGLARRKFVQIRHENLQTRLGSHTRVAIHQLFLIMSQVKIKPGVIGNINHDEIDVMHGELSEFDVSTPELQKIAPLLNLCHSIDSSN
jgi:hypothetical protein